MSFIVKFLKFFGLQFIPKQLPPVFDSYADHIQRENQRLLVNYPIGRKVLLAGNSPDSYLIGEIYGHKLFTRGNQLLPLIKKRDTEEVVVSSNTSPMYWNEELEKIFDKLTWWERWNVYSKGLSSITKEDAERYEQTGSFAH